jgi:hypothetical protein
MRKGSKLPAAERPLVGMPVDVPHVSGMNCHPLIKEREIVVNERPSGGPIPSFIS